MRSKLVFDLVKLLALFGAIWALFVIFPILPDKTDLGITIDKEEQLGEYLFENITETPDFKIIDNGFVDSCMAAIHTRLTNSLGKSDYQYQIYIFRNSMINAFALPGGIILVSSGLVEFSDKPEELAAVLAHEMGHIEKRHIISKLIKELGINLLTSKDPLVIGEISKIAGSTMFDRKQEKEADEFAMDLLLKAQIEPRTIATFFRRIEQEVGSYNEKAEIFMTHPHNKTRIRYALEYEIPDDFEGKEFDLDWRKIKEC